MGAMGISALHFTHLAAKPAHLTLSLPNIEVLDQQIIQMFSNIKKTNWIDKI